MAVHLVPGTRLLMHHHNYVLNLLCFTQARSRIALQRHYCPQLIGYVPLMHPLLARG